MFGNHSLDHRHIAVASIGVALPASAQRPYANCALAHDGRYDIPSDEPAYWDGGDRDHDGSPVTPNGAGVKHGRLMTWCGAGVVLVVGAAGLVWAAPAWADGGWEAVASSPSHEQIDFAWGFDQASAEARALSQCAELQRASDCLLLASGPDCVAVAWDGDQPINHAHGVSGGGRDVVIPAAMAAAGPYANDPSARCSGNRSPTEAGTVATDGRHGACIVRRRVVDPSSLTPTTVQH